MTSYPSLPLAELCTVIRRGLTPNYVDEGGLLVINQKCIRDQRLIFGEAKRTAGSADAVPDDRLLRSLDILVNSTGVGTLGRLSQIQGLPEPTTADSHVTILRPDPVRVVPRYLGYALHFCRPEIEAMSEGSTGQTELARSRLKELRVPSPPESEQRAIAYILGTLDNKLAANSHLCHVREVMTREIFRSWFVDFDLVRAKLAGRDSELPDKIAQLFPERLKLSTLGEIPAGWSITTLGDHVSSTRGLSYRGSGLSDTGIPLHNLNSVLEGGGYKFTGIKYYDAEFKERHVIHPGDVIIANTEQGHKRLLIGFAAVIPRGFGAVGLFSHHLFRVKLDSRSTLTPLFLCHLLNSRSMQAVVSRYANGTTVNMLPRDGLQLPEFVLPPKELIQSFDQLATLTNELREQITWENQAIATLREVLLPVLMSGGMRVGWVATTLSGLDK